LVGGPKMNWLPADSSDLLETKDSIAAVSVFRGWKNFFFGMVLLCLVLTQAAFWLIDLKIVPGPAAVGPAISPPAAVAVPAAQTAKETGQGNNTGARAGMMVERILAEVDYPRTARVVELINGALIIAAVLLAAATFLTLQISLVGRLGGLNHISRAFVLAVLAVLALIPWQTVGLYVPGVIWTPQELAQWLPTKTADLGSTILFYLRFTGGWAVVVLLMLVFQVRSIRWSKDIIRRLERI
jgi:hypothetical protein